MWASYTLSSLNRSDEPTAARPARLFQSDCENELACLAFRCLAVPAKDILRLELCGPWRRW